MTTLPKSLLMKYIHIFLMAIMSGIAPQNMAQNPPAFDDPASDEWPTACSVVELPSSLDSSLQRAYFYASTSSQRQPLIVSLHTWSGDYSQRDPLVWQCIRNDWNYIHPDFRGSNNTPQACGSEYVISDIEDAIAYAVKEGNVNEGEIHVIGSSGGGYATLISYMTTSFPVKSFSAWVPISDIESWYYESLGRKNKYAGDIIKSISPGQKNLDTDEARKRSPLYMTYSNDRTPKGRLQMFAGIHDGYTGSVPITQSIHMYNNLVASLGGREKDLVHIQDALKLITLRMNPESVMNEYISDRNIHYIKSYDNVSLTIFEGGHEMLSGVALEHVTCCGEVKKNLRILTIGDSNGASEDGWVEQLRKVRPLDIIYNVSFSGNTIGFDNNGQERLNTLKQIDRYLTETIQKSGNEPLNLILINLGTNDCKAVFDERVEEIGPNLEKLIKSVQNFPYTQNHKPEVVIISPPPYGPDEVVLEKYKGGDRRVQTLLPQFEEIAKKTEVKFIDIYHVLKPTYRELAPDGVHMTSEGQRIIAETIHNFFRQNLLDDSYPE